MNHPSVSTRASLLRCVGALALAASLLIAEGVAAAARIDESRLQALGFKVLEATAAVQLEWVQRLPAGEIRPMQRNGKKYFVYPDAPGKRVLVGGPKEYEAYRQLHPESGPTAKDVADKERALRLKQNEVMSKATARDLSDPFLGVTWGDLIW